ncbi:ash family protein [Salmonella enterica]|nr:ash family protein [Salmonella enterica subsp. enterica serovar Baildon]EDX5603331.1 ash family protein [Salmonella enterica subsp. enterica serovar Baildon]EDY4931779.1 ash family protein [Salmonella enterica]
MTTHKNRLLQSALMGYISPVPHKTGAGIETPLTTYAHNRASGFFVCKASSHLCIMVGRTGPLSGGPGSCVAGSLNPVRLTTPSLRPLGGEFSKFTTYEGYPSWPTANNAVPALTSSASIPRPKSTAACTAPTIWRISCVSKCSPAHATAGCYGCRQSWTTSPTISATFSDCLTSQRTPGKNINRLPLLFAAGGLRTPVIRENLL